MLFIKDRIYELALFTVDQSKLTRFQNSAGEFKNEIKSLPGCINIQRYNEVNSDNLYMDLCEWENAEKATEADIKVQSDQNFKSLMEPISNVELFEHTELDNLLEIEKNNSGIIDLYYYSVYDYSKTFQEERSKFYDVILKKDPSGLNSVVMLKSIVNENWFVDLLLWKKIEDTQKFNSKFKNSKELEKYNSVIKEFKLYYQFKL